MSLGKGNKGNKNIIALLLQGLLIWDWCKRVYRAKIEVIGKRNLFRGRKNKSKKNFIVLIFLCLILIVFGSRY